MSTSGITQEELDAEISVFKEERNLWVKRLKEAKEALPIFEAKARELRENGGEDFAEFLELISIEYLKQTMTKCEKQIEFCRHAENKLTTYVAKLDFETQDMLDKLGCHKEWEEFMLAEKNT